MGVRKGEPWGGPARAAPEVTVDGGDAEVAAAVRHREGVRVALAPSSTAELGRAVGATRGSRGVMDLPCDALVIDADGRELLAVNMVVAGIAPDRQRRWSRPRRARVVVDDRPVHDGPAVAVVVGSGQFRRGADLIPRGHPGDGRAEVQVYAVGPRERAGMRARLARGAHVPHPEIAQTSGRRVEVTFARPWRLEVDGVRRDPTRRLVVDVRPGAFVLVV